MEAGVAAVSPRTPLSARFTAAAAVKAPGTELVGNAIAAIGIGSQPAPGASVAYAGDIGRIGDARAAATLDSCRRAV